MTSSPQNEPPRWHRLEDLDPEPPRRPRRSGRRSIFNLLIVAALFGIVVFLLLGVLEQVG